MPRELFDDILMMRSAVLRDFLPPRCRLFFHIHIYFMVSAALIYLFSPMRGVIRCAFQKMMLLSDARYCRRRGLCACDAVAAAVLSMRLFIAPAAFIFYLSYLLLCASRRGRRFAFARRRCRLNAHTMRRDATDSSSVAAFYDFRKRHFSRRDAERFLARSACARGMPPDMREVLSAFFIFLIFRADSYSRHFTTRSLRRIFISLRCARLSPSRRLLLFRSQRLRFTGRLPRDDASLFSRCDV